MFPPTSEQSSGLAPQRSRTRAIVFAAGAIGLLLLAAGTVLLSYRIEAPPDYAKVIGDDEKLTYASTPCILFNTLDREMIANRAQISDPSKELELLSFANEHTMADMRADAKWKRDTTCNAAIGYDQIVTVWMRIFGFRSRWDENGVWRW